MSPWEQGSHLGLGHLGPLTTLRHPVFSILTSIVQLRHLKGRERKLDLPKVIPIITSWQNVDLDPDLTPEPCLRWGRYRSQGRPPRQSEAAFRENRRNPRGSQIKQPPPPRESRQTSRQISEPLECAVRALEGTCAPLKRQRGGTFESRSRGVRGGVSAARVDFTG